MPITTLRTKEQGQAERGASVREAEASNPFPWERQQDEPPQAFMRFLTYRSMPPGERSMRKLGISGTLAFRWAKRFQWTKRTAAYDAWVCELSDATANHAVLRHRQSLVRFGSVSLNKAERTVAKLDEAKLSANEAIDLAVNGAKLARQGLGIADGGATVADRAPQASVSVSLGLGQLGWVNRPAIDVANNNEVKQNEVVVPAGEKVLGETPAGPRHVRLAERIVNCPPGKSKGKGNE